MNTTNQAQPDYTGFLKKKGALNPNFQNRWFELVGPRLFYYKDNKNKTPAGVILLKNCTLAKDKKNKGMFFIQGPHLKRTYELLSSSEQDCDGWMQAINSLIQGKPKLSENEKKEEKEEIKQKTETVQIEGVKSQKKLD